jgi:hypothetical protein
MARYVERKQYYEPERTLRSCSTACAILNFGGTKKMRRTIGDGTLFDPFQPWMRARTIITSHSLRETVKLSGYQRIE